MSATTNSVSLSSAHDTEVRLERGERVVGDLRLGRADDADERALADVREPDERDVGHQLQLELAASAPRRARPARRRSGRAACSTRTWRCHGHRGRRATASQRSPWLARSASSSPVYMSLGDGALGDHGSRASRRACRAGPCPCRARRPAARRCGWSLKASSDATLRSATSHTSPPLPPSPPFGPPNATGPLTTERRRSRRHRRHRARSVGLRRRIRS